MRLVATEHPVGQKNLPVRTKPVAGVNGKLFLREGGIPRFRRPGCGSNVKERNYLPAAGAERQIQSPSFSSNKVLPEMPPSSFAFQPTE